MNNNYYIKKPYFHFTISIWNWLFISKFWKWDIYITTFEEMHKMLKSLYINENILKWEEDKFYYKEV